jgi:YidC/Oxa1 family membrane protein insertase
MDNRTLLAVFLSITFYYTWYSIFGPTPQPVDVDVENKSELVVEDLILAKADGHVESNGSPSLTAPKTEEKAGSEAVPTKILPPIRTLPFKGCHSMSVLSTDGGGLHSLSLDNFRSQFEMTPIYSWLWGKVTGAEDGPWTPYGEEPDFEEILSDQARVFEAGSGEEIGKIIRYEVLNSTESSIELRGETESGLVVTQRIGINDSKVCGFKIDVEWLNPSSSTIVGPVWMAMSDKIDPGNTGMMAMYGNSKSMSWMVDEDVTVFAAADNEEDIVVNGKVDWMGISDRYFGLFMLPETNGSSHLRVHQSGDEEAGFRLEQRWIQEATIGPNQSHKESFRVYVGPLDMDLLTGTSESLEKVIQFGWFSFFARPLLWFLKVFYAGIGNWGVSIIMLTLMVKVIFFPLTNTAFRSSQAMAALQPEMKEMKEKLKDKPEELNKRMVELFRENNVNPLGGCLPMILQMPVWFALYRVLLNSVELYHTEFLYIRDLSSIDPYGIMPAIVVVLMVVQQSFMPTGNMDPAQARMMKLMPLMFGFFFFSFPAGLVVYIFVNMVLSIGQQWLIKRTFKLSGEKAATAA